MKRANADGRKISRATGKRLNLTLANVRSAITNGSQLLHDVNHNSTWMRRLRDLINMHIADLGGDECVTEAERRIIRRAAMLTLQLEMQEQRWAHNSEGEASRAQLDVYQRCSNTLRRLLESLGLQRRARDVTPPDPLTYARTCERLEAAE
jgi:hypothetical protein